MAPNGLRLFGFSRRRLMLLGRRDECAMLDRLLEDARAGRSGVLVVRGEAGIGKTALLDHAVDAASDLTVLRAAGMESERELAFAALEQFCAPLLDRLDRLPAPQREALQTTFGLAEGAVPDRLLVGLATLGLLSEAADERPLLCVIDDAQWLDRASAQALGFVARRLLAESALMLFAAREPNDLLTGLPELVVERLSDDDARKLLASVIPGRLDGPVADQLLAETRGNPLALLELTRGLSSAQLAGGFGLPGAVSVPSRIEERFTQRLEVLPEDTRRLLLLAAAEPAGDRMLLRRAAEGLGIAGPVLEPAASAGLVEIDRGVRFRHPLVRSAVYRAATPQQRRLVHRALAEGTDRRADPDRRAWHLAAATTGLDEDVAVELERAAGRARARGGLAAAAAFLARGASLTPDPATRAERALAAAEIHLAAGSLDDAQRMLAVADEGPLSDLERGRADLLRARIAFASSHSGDAPPLLLDAARRLHGIDVASARDTYLEALAAAMFAGRFGRPGSGVIDVASAARAAPTPVGPPRPSDVLLDGLTALFTDGLAPAVPILRRAHRAFDADQLPPEQLRWLWLASASAQHIWDDRYALALADRHVRLTREADALGELPLALTQRVFVHVLAGELGAAEALVGEIHAAMESIGGALVPYAAVALAAFQGREAEAAALIERGRSDGSQRGEGVGLTVLDWAEAVLGNGLGRYAHARTVALRVVDHPQDISSSNWGAVELIEAAARSGRPESALAAQRRLVRTTEICGTDWALGIRARSSALLADDASAEDLHVEAVERLQRSRVRIELARAHLLYGEWLLGERRRVDARERLRTAHEMFTAMGAKGFAGRAERALWATGERVRERRVDTRQELNHQEAQVARLARDGLSNAEIGERCFISQHTVAYHLRRVFGKLGITSRDELSQALPPEPRAALA
jgi:DNA-binding CsgD family transcriptional regulator